MTEGAVCVSLVIKILFTCVIKIIHFNQEQRWVCWLKENETRARKTRINIGLAFRRWRGLRVLKCCKCNAEKYLIEQIQLTCISLKQFIVNHFVKGHGMPKHNQKQCSSAKFMQFCFLIARGTKVKMSANLNSYTHQQNL